MHSGLQAAAVVDVSLLMSASSIEGQITVSVIILMVFVLTSSLQSHYGTIVSNMSVNVCIFPVTHVFAFLYPREM